MIENIEFMFGASPETGSLSFSPASVTILVGPNNGGKSLTLKEIYKWCQTGQVSKPRTVKSVVFREIDKTQLYQMFSEVKSVDQSDAVNGHVKIGFGSNALQVQEGYFIRNVGRSDDRTFFCKYYLGLLSHFMSGDTRLIATRQQPAGDLLKSYSNAFQYLYLHDSRREHVRGLICKAFSLFFVLDPTNTGQLRIRLSNKKLPNKDIERHLTDESLKFMGEATAIEDYSDGVKAFIGILVEIFGGKSRVLFIDEPEAFLHPTLAQTLGTEIGKIIRNENKQVFISTHSPFFVMGAIESGAEINVIRLTYEKSVATARILTESDLRIMMRNPLLRSAGVLNGLFARGVVVCESDADRAFYQEINTRLTQFQPDNALRDVIFINAQNKQTIPQILGALRKLGIAAAGVVDLDIVMDEGTDFAKWLVDCSIPETMHDPVRNAKNKIKSYAGLNNIKLKKVGLDNLHSDLKDVSDLFEVSMKDYGIFICRPGELENWLKALGVTGHGPPWLQQMFAKMGDDPDNENYLKPSQGDVWSFIASIKLWIENPNRKGIP